MAWNPSPKVADCREIARKWGKQQVIILAVDPACGTLEMATYGQTRELCAEAKRLGDHAYQAVMDHYVDDVLPGAKLAPPDKRCGSFSELFKGVEDRPAYKAEMAELEKEDAPTEANPDKTCGECGLFNSGRCFPLASETCKNWTPKGS